MGLGSHRQLGEKLKAADNWVESVVVESLADIILSSLVLPHGSPVNFRGRLRGRVQQKKNDVSIAAEQSVKRTQYCRQQSA